MGHGGALVDSMPVDRRVAGSNPVLNATQVLWQVLHLQNADACSASACKLRHGVNGMQCGRERI